MNEKDVYEISCIDRNAAIKTISAIAGKFSNKPLRDLLPYEALSYPKTERYLKFLDIEVIAEYDGRYIKWPGTHKNVLTWWKLSNGYVVGWNESDSRGWSFPVIKLKN